MKKLFFILISLGTLLFSCNGNKTTNQKAIEDSLKLDSAYKEFAKVAWGDANFGINTEQALKTAALGEFTVEAKGEQFVYDTIMHCPESKIYEIRAALGMYKIEKFEAKFNNGELTEITITSEPVSLENYEVLNHDFESFNKGLEEKYGKVQQSIPPLTEDIIQNLKTSHILSGDYMASKGKDITCVIYKRTESFEDKIYYEIDIINYNYPKREKKKNEKEEAESREYYKKQDSIKNVIKHNSF